MSRPYAEVIGDPIAHSKSPLIHNFWLGKLGIEADYRRCHVRADELEDYFTRRRADAQWRGCNVTLPHKIAVLNLIGSAEEDARSTGAANTVFREGASLRTTNTDIAGVLAALPETLMPGGAQVCVLGTGGAARAALAACKRRGVGSVVLTARNQEAARGLLREFGLEGTVGPLGDSHFTPAAEVMINATSLGMTGGAPMPTAVLRHIREHPKVVVFDMVYSPLETDLLRAAAEAGCRVVDGLAMLIGQAAVAFERFFGEPAPREHDAELRTLLTA